MPASSPNLRPFRRFMQWFCILLGSFLAVTALLSLTVNPWRINRSPLSLDMLDASREISETVRVGKAALANKGDWEVVIIGSSRMEIAFDPAHRAFEGKQSVNLAMAAATLTETVPVAHYTLDRNPNLKTLIFGVEPGDLYNTADSRTFTNFYESPFSDNNRSIERSINQLVGGRSLADSISTIGRKINGKRPKRNQLGLWLAPEYPLDLRSYIETAFKQGHSETEEAWNLDPETLREEKAELLSGLIRRARSKGINVHLVFPAQHALKLIHPELDSPPEVAWETNFRAIVDICAKENATESAAPPLKLWSFLDFNIHTTEPMPSIGAPRLTMKGWSDLGHATVEVGNMALDTMFLANPSDKPFGKDLLKLDWETFRRNWIASHADYCKNHREDVSWWRSL